MKEEYEKLYPYFEKIEELERATNELTFLVKNLDAYSKNLENQLKPFL
jgi:hypothetical protein